MTAAAAAVPFPGPSWRARKIAAIGPAREIARDAFVRAMRVRDDQAARLWQTIVRQLDAERDQHARELIGRGCCPVGRVTA